VLLITTSTMVPVVNVLPTVKLLLLLALIHNQVWLLMIPVSLVMSTTSLPLIPVLNVLIIVPLVLLPQTVLLVKLDISQLLMHVLPVPTTV